MVFLYTELLLKKAYTLTFNRNIILLVSKIQLGIPQHKSIDVIDLGTLLYFPKVLSLQ